MKTIILDFDQTIADTSALESLRKSRNWSSVYAALHRISLYPGVTDLLSSCRQKGYKVAVVTNSPKKYCELALSHLGLEVDAVVGYHDTARRKPHPDPILLALRLVRGNPALSMGLGDTANDLKAYKAAGITAVACLWGCQRAEELHAEAPCITIQQADALIHHLQ